MPATLERRPTGLNPELKSDFRVGEYKENTSDQALIKDVVSYLGEYRFSLPKFDYQLKYSAGNLKDPDRGDTMRTITQRAIEKKDSEGISSVREHAEKAGFMSLDDQLMSAKDKDTIVWASPPGLKSEGYGEYGFVFIGRVNAQNPSEKIIRMTAIRVEQPTIERFNKAVHLLTGEKTDYKTAEEFLSHPKVLNEPLEEGYVDSVLGMSFSFKPNKEEQEKFALIIRQMFPLILEFIHSAKDPWKPKSEKLKELYALENYALKLKADYGRTEEKRENFLTNFHEKPRLLDIREKYGNKPPEVAGSCPATNNNKNSSSNIFSKGSFLNNLLEDDMNYEFEKDGPCVKCSADVKCGPCGLCRACDLAIRASQKISLN